MEQKICILDMETLKPPMENRQDKRDLLLMVFGKEGDLEHLLLAVKHYLMFELEEVDQGLRRSFKRMGKSFLV